MANNPKFIAKIESEEPTLKLAVLIDADNAQPVKIESLLKEIATFGEATVKRIYGDFTAPTSAQWKKVLHKYAIKPIQQFAYTTGKNATDSMLIIDAMDLLYTRRFDGFCLISSDSDFTGLALRIREEGLMVVGFGEQKTPEAFRNACHKFIFTEVLGSHPAITENPLLPLRPVGGNGSVVEGGDLAEAECTATRPPISPGASPVESAKLGNGSPQLTPTDAQSVLVDALSSAPCDEAGWINLGSFGSYLTKLKPDFDPRLYGSKKLSDLVRTMPHALELTERMTDGSPAKAIYIRRRS